MKTRKTYRWAMFVILPICFLFIIAFFTQATKALFYPYMIVNWIALAIAVFFIFSPWGNVRLECTENPGKMHSLTRLLGLIFLLQLSMLMMYVGLYTFTFDLLPVNSGSVSLTQVFATMWQKWVIFPWGIVAMLATSLAFICYNDKRDAFISTALMPLFNNKHNSLTTHVIQFCIRNATIVGIVLTLGIYMMIVAVLLTHDNPGMIPTGQNTPAFVTAIVLLVFAFLPPIKYATKRLMRRRVPSILGLCAMILIGALVILICSAVFSTITVQSAPSKHPLYYDTLIKIGREHVWLLLTTNWFLLLTPISAIIIGYWSRGYTVRSCLIATLIGPAIISFTPHFHYWMPAWLKLVFIFAGFLIFFMILTQKNIRSMLVLSYIPKNGIYKARDYHFFFRRVFRFTAAIPYFYLPIGIMFIALMAYFAGILTCIILGLAAISFIIALATRDLKAKPDR
ncbi:MAG: BCCT family transporter [Coxiellaceae bacterium]|nr:BCCT family transporter [Coxiellaceae bacterium]